MVKVAENQRVASSVSDMLTTESTETTESER